VCFQHIKHVAHEIQGPLLHKFATEDNLLRIDPVGDGERRLLVVERSAGQAQDISLLVVEGDGEPAAIGAGV
jgi:hypothetical protein